MFSFILVNPSIVSFNVDLKAYNEKIISKVLYWLSDTYLTSWKNESDIAIINIEKKEGLITQIDMQRLKERLSQDFIDFKTRDIVNNETKAIRELLLVKAFSATDEFDEKCLFPMSEE
jgi:His-Xaa-Ser system protein HxsD